MCQTELFETKSQPNRGETETKKCLKEGLKGPQQNVERKFGSGNTPAFSF